ncbi:hypothetical protein OL548_21700 [Lysinibacillus sp. MHQ-1]|nr:hypothetical protein OL548_21700 [Lysinibacillus sp. MHQ-1]
MSIFLVALNMRPAVTAIGPLFNVLMINLHVSNTSMSFLTSIPVFLHGFICSFCCTISAQAWHKISNRAINGYSCLRKWAALIPRKLSFISGYKFCSWLGHCDDWPYIKCV